MADNMVTVHGEPSYSATSNRVTLFVTRRGGHMAPVRFRVGKRRVEPYSLSPWKPDELKGKTIPLLKVLRGDFLCLPFGVSRGYPDVHGETANRNWKLKRREKDRLVLEMELKKPACRVQKALALRMNHRAVYQEHRISGLRGSFSYGHHAILRFPERSKPSYVNTSPFFFGSVKPERFSNPADGEYGALKTGARFKSLSRVPLAEGGYTSLREYPSRPGYEDLVMLSSRPSDFAWTAATLDGYVWLSLKDPRVLPNTLFWITNGGRHGPPWNGRHTRRLGLEEVNSHFSDGLEVSRKGLLQKYGVPTTANFSPAHDTFIRLIHLVHPVPGNFGMVTGVKRAGDGAYVLITGAGGKTVKAPVAWKFLYSSTP